MRQPPAYIEQALRQYCPELGLEWSGRVRAWYVTYGGRRLFTLQRGNAPIVELDGNREEVLAIVIRADNWRDGPDRLKGMARAAKEREYQARVSSAAAMAEAGRHGDDMGGVFARGGAKPFVHIQGNPLAVA